MWGKPELALVVVRGSDESRILQRPRRPEVEIRERKREQCRDADEDPGARYPPPFAEPAREPHDDQEREAEGDEPRGEHGPVLDEPVDVAEIGLPVPAVPPVARRTERDPHEPGDRDPEHPEQHPGADRPCGRLAEERDPSSRVDGEHGQERDLREHPEHVVETLEARCARDERRAENRIDVDRGERQVVGDVGWVQEDRAGDEDRADDDRDGDLQDVSPAAGAEGVVEGELRRLRLPAENGSAVGIAIGERAWRTRTSAPRSGGTTRRGCAAPPASARSRACTTSRGRRGRRGLRRACWPR